MRLNLFLAFAIMLIFAACSTYETKDLYGAWRGDVWSFSFKEDGTCTCGQKGSDMPCTYRAVGNTLEISRDGLVFLPNVTIKSIKADVMVMEFRSLGTTIEERLARMK